jgi:chromate reductase, NAD(P)H dehydrogenase (quinone)
VAELTVLGIAGSLRANAYSMSVLRAAVELAPPDMKIDVADISGLPLFNQDEEGSPPPKVTALKSRVKASDAVLFSLNEHNYGLSAAEKNVLDWLSRPSSDNAWNGKPAGILSESVGMIGGARAQYELRQSMVFVNMFPINRPEVIIPFVKDKVDGQGRLVDETARKFIGLHLAELARFARLLQHSP